MRLSISRVTLCNYPVLVKVLLISYIEVHDLLEILFLDRKAQSIWCLWIFVDREVWKLAFLCSALAIWYLEGEHYWAAQTKSTCTSVSHWTWYWLPQDQWISLSWRRTRSLWEDKLTEDARWTLQSRLDQTWSSRKVKVTALELAYSTSYEMGLSQRMQRFTGCNNSQNSLKHSQICQSLPPLLFHIWWTISMINRVANSLPQVLLSYHVVLSRLSSSKITAVTAGDISDILSSSEIRPNWGSYLKVSYMSTVLLLIRWVEQNVFKPIIFKNLMPVRNLVIKIASGPQDVATIIITLSGRCHQSKATAWAHL